jgi:hypothetical protein
VEIAYSKEKYLIRIRMLCATREDRAPGRDWEICRDEAVARVQVALPRFVDDPEVPRAHCFRVLQRDVDFQSLERNLIARVVETNE